MGTRRVMIDRKIVEHLRLGKSGRCIEKALRVGDKRIRKVRELATAHGYLEPGAALPPPPAPLFPAEQRLRNAQSDPERLLLPHLQWMTERIAAGWHKVTLFEELPVKVGRSSFYRFLDRRGLGEPEPRDRVIPEIIHRPGEAMQLDWGHLCTVPCATTGKPRKVWAFVGVLGYSRYLVVRLVWSMTTETTLAVLEDMFREIGGIPGRVTTDNPKCFSLNADAFQPVLNPVFELFAHHNGFVIEALPAAEPEKKGKVERPMPYVRRLFEAHGEWKGLEEAQEYLQRKLVMANERKHGTTLEKPAERFRETEAPALRPLPATLFERVEIAEPTVREGGHVRFRNKAYSVGLGLKGEQVLVIGTRQKVSIYHKGILIETHDRITDSNRSKSTKKHHRAPHERTIEDVAAQIAAAQDLGPHVGKVAEAMLATLNGFVELRMVFGLFALGKIYGADDLDAACELALETHACTYRHIKHILESTAQERPAKSVSKPTYIRPISEYVRHVQAQGAIDASHSHPRLSAPTSPLNGRAGATRDPRGEPPEGPRPEPDAFGAGM